jgi:guanosine-3',5'-bis(diphosphate) 3'-pyrophosphohydrolase
MAAMLADLLKKTGSYLPADKLGLVQKAYEFAQEQHRGQVRLSGQPYITHPLQTAMYLADLHQDASTLAAALLHDVVEDCGVSTEDLAEQFNPEVARLVDGVTKLTRIDLLALGSDGDRPAEERNAQAESIRKMLVAMAEDIRVVLIKLGDRLHNMQTLGYLPITSRQRIAQETLDIYAPLAHRLGMWDMKWQLEDLAFRHVNPKDYRSISRLLSTRREQREQFIDQICKTLSMELEQQGIQADVHGRPKHLYSIFQKIQKYASQGKEVNEIYDLYALRVIVKTKANCYNALGVVHTLWHPIPGQFDDYIASPKENMYQSLHTSVMCEGATPLEVQLRTEEMHQTAEYGVSAHWSYKEGRPREGRFEEKMAWLRQLLEWQREVPGAEEFLESVKTDIFQDQVYIYTPKGDVKELVSGSTPIDFAYKVHTELGHLCVGAKVNGSLTALDAQLENGDTVEIITTKQPRGPTLDWLNPALGYVKTASAQQKIRQWFRRQEKSSNIERGKDLLRRSLHRLPQEMNEADLVQLLRYDSLEEVLLALGSGNLSVAQLEGRVLAQREPTPPLPHMEMPPESPTTGIHVLGTGDLLTRTARCCNPLPGDEIIGYITRTRGVTVHQGTCRAVRREDEPERLVRVSWGPIQKLYPVRVELVAFDRVGLLRDITTLVSAEKVNIASVVTDEQQDGTATITLTLYTSSLAQLGRVFSKLESIQGLQGIVRRPL